jgi:hypothetical protein
MWAVLVINVVVSLGMLLLTACIAMNAREFYPSTIWPIVHAGVAMILAFVGLCVPRRKLLFQALSSAGLMSLGLTAVYGGSDIPGGDDGMGFGWMFLVVGGSVPVFVIGLLTLLLGAHYDKRRRNRAAAAEASNDSAEKAPPVHSDRRRGVRWSMVVLWGFLVMALLFLVWCVVPITWESSERQGYGNGIVVETHWRNELLALPVPFYHDTSHLGEVVYLDGEEWFRTGQLSLLEVSPTGQFIVAYRWERDGMEIWNTATRDHVLLTCPDSKEEFPNHYYTFPFRFERWDSDSTFLVEVSGYDDDFESYRQVWRVEAATAERRRIDKPDIGQSPPTRDD